MGFFNCGYQKHDTCQIKKYSVIQSDQKWKKKMKAKGEDLREQHTHGLL